MHWRTITFSILENWSCPLKQAHVITSLLPAQTSWPANFILTSSLNLSSPSRFLPELGQTLSKGKLTGQKEQIAKHFNGQTFFVP